MDIATLNFQQLIIIIILPITYNHKIQSIAQKHSSWGFLTDFRTCIVLEDIKRTCLSYHHFISIKTSCHLQSLFPPNMRHIWITVPTEAL